MFGRWGFGPVFACECRLAARRWQLYAVRAGFVALILAALTFVWLRYADRRAVPGSRELAALGERFFYALVGTQLTLVLLAAPAATAGALCLDKARGTLHHLFVTDLSSVELVLGKLGARLLPVLSLLGCSVPVVFLCTLLGGIQPDALAGAFLVTLGVAVLGCTLALTLSVWGTKTYEVLLATYFVMIALLLAYPVWSSISRFNALPTPPNELLELNPYWMAFAPYAVPGSVTSEHYAVYFAVCLGLSALLLAVAIAKVRPVTLRQAAKPAKRKRAAVEVVPRSVRRLFGPSLSGNPVLWREWHGRRPSRWARWIWGIYFIGAVALSAFAVIVSWQTTNRAGSPAPLIIGFEAVIGLLLLSVAAPNPLAEERARDTLDVLLTVPLTTSEIVGGKWWGTFRSVARLAALPWLTLVGVVVAERPERLPATLVLLGLVLACGACFTSLGLALATWTTRLGRAVTLNVCAYVLVAVVWIVFVMLLPLDHRSAERLAMASPFYGAGYYSHTIASNNRFPGDSEFMDAMYTGLSYTAAYVVLAAVFYLATLRTFDRCVGRMTDRPPPRDPSPRPSARQAVPVP